MKAPARLDIALSRMVVGKLDEGSRRRQQGEGNQEAKGARNGNEKTWMSGRTEESRK